MNKTKTIKGFSKLSKRGKIKWIVENFFKDPENVMRELVSYWHTNEEQQKILDGFSENTISNYPMPYSVAPNFVINNKAYCVPMVIEESSVVAAASAAAKFWMDRGGFKTEILDTKKLGHVHFKWNGDKEILKSIFPELKTKLIHDCSHITQNMRKRGGGILDIVLEDFTSEEKGLYQLKASFKTCDSMGANFINSCLEQFSKTLQVFVLDNDKIENKEIDVIMSILSNYTPECIVRATVSCKVEELGRFANNMAPEIFAKKFKAAVKIAHIDSYRATTHNKGIFNGVDAVVLATGNDFRAIEACGHTYASRTGKYKSLSHCSVENGVFKFWLDIPLAVGTIGGLTSIHPIAKRSLELLGNPNAEELMSVIAATGLAQNFAALRSLITTGIQQGHMKMHLQNIMVSLSASDQEKEKTSAYFSDKIVSFSDVRNYISSLRSS
jgi:hydroxymethylglutaryl-CoA reductase